MTATQTTRNTINWFEIPVRDIAKAKALYGAMLNAKLEVSDFGGIPHAVFPQAAAGKQRPADLSRCPGWSRAVHLARARGGREARAARNADRTARHDRRDRGPRWQRDRPARRAEGMSAWWTWLASITPPPKSKRS